VEPTPNEVFKRLVIDEKDWQFFVPELNEIDDNAEPQRLLPSVAGAQKLRRRANELLCQLRDAAKTTDAEDGTRVTNVQSVLRNLYRRSRTEAEERGITTLHLTFGMLECWSKISRQTVRSPLVLVPVNLGRTQGVTPFKLSLSDDEITLNPALEVKLQNDFNLSLPATPDEWTDDSLGGYLDRFGNTMARQHWRVGT